MANTTQDQPLIIGNQLRSAREALGLSIEEVFRVLKVEPETVSAWEVGAAEPSIDELWQLADLYGREVDYFLKPVAEAAIESDFRVSNIRTLPQLDITDRRVLVKFQELCRAQTDLERVLGIPTEPALRKVSPPPGPSELARDQRVTLGRPTRPIRDLRELLELAGVKVFHLPVPKNEFSGFSWWHPEFGPGVLVNASDGAGRRAFTSAHELAHLLVSDRPVVCDLTLDVDDERYADRFAVEFLIPTGDLLQELEIRPALRESPNDSDLGSLGRRYGVSLEAISRKLESLEVLPAGFTDSSITRWKAEERYYKGSKKPVWRRRLGGKFIELAFGAHSKGLISLSKLAQLLEIDVRKALDLTKTAKP